MPKINVKAITALRKKRGCSLQEAFRILSAEAAIKNLEAATDFYELKTATIQAVREIFQIQYKI